MSIHCTPLTNDALFDGALICRQYRQGYRFSVDAVLAAHFCIVQAGARILDLGCGCGVISLILAFRHQDKDIRVTGLELQPDLAMLTQDNILANHLDSVVSVVEGDLRRIGDYLDPESFDLVVANPPYRHPETGRVSPTGQRARARHEIDANLENITEAAAFAVKNRGRAVFVYPANRTAALIAALKQRRLEPKRLQPVYSYPESENASLTLVEAIKNGGEEMELMAPFYIYTAQNGPYTEQMQRLYVSS